MRKYVILLLFILSSIGYQLVAQQYYTAHVGTFVDVRPQDFDGIRPMGFVYALELEGNLNQIYLGNFSQETRAQQMVNALRGRGFTSAQVIPVKPSSTQQAAVIQIATRYTNRPLNWAEFKRAGDLNVIVEDERIKVFTTTFPDVNTAKNMLPRIQALGFSDAFVKTVVEARLIPVTAISTGIKEDLIPLNLTENKTPVRTRPQTPVVQADPSGYNVQGNRIITSSTPSVPRPAQSTNDGMVARSVEVERPKPAAITVPNKPITIGSSPAVTKPAAVNSSLPAIRDDIKRNSALNLQGVLKKEGHYDNSVDGFYGPGTTSAYTSMLTKDPTVQKYSTLAATIAADNTSADAFFSWSEIQLLYTIAMDINPDAVKQTSKLNAASVRRYQLSLSEKGLGPAQQTLLMNWQNSTWKNIDQWAAGDTFLLETASALRFAYFQSQVRLEDYYMDKGFKTEEARTLALASLQAIVGVAFERF